VQGSNAEWELCITNAENMWYCAKNGLPLLNVLLHWAPHNSGGGGLGTDKVTSRNLNHIFSKVGGRMNRQQQDAHP